VNDPRSFGAALRRERERRGITLDTIAEQTKVSAALLEGLERGDLARWPAGIFRRAFVRGYADAVGLDSRTVLEAFLRIYPDEGAPAVAPAHVVAAAFGQGQPLRLTLADDDKLKTLLSRSRLAGVAIDLLALLLPAAVVTVLVSPLAGWMTLGCIAVGYHAVGALALGTTPGLWLTLSLLNRRHAGAPLATRAQAEDEGTDRAGEVEARDEQARGPAEILFHQRRRRSASGRRERYPRRAGGARS
jgi:transcriptional regulator with XRE-family HTH domain